MVDGRWLMAGLVLAAAGLPFGCLQPPVEPARPTVEVKRGDLVFSGSFYGEIEARTSHAIFVPDFRNTWQIAVDWVLPDGTRVKKGDTVLVFAKGTMEEDLRDKESELAVAEASYQKAKEQLEDEHINKLLANRRSSLAVELAKLNVVEGVNLVSKLDLEKAKVELARAQLQHELDGKEIEAFQRKKAAGLEVERLKVVAAAEKVKEIREQLAQMEVKAPADGVLYAPYTRLNWVMAKVAPGKVVRPGDRVLEIPELDDFNASVYVRQRDATLVRPGDEAKVVATMFPDRVIKGKVVSKDEFATTRNERTGQSNPQGNLKEMRVVLELEQTTEALRPGGTVRADISTVLAREVLLAPLAALKEEPGGAHSAVLASGRKVRVKLGQTTTTHAEIVEGLSEGDQLRLE